MRDAIGISTQLTHHCHEKERTAQPAQLAVSCRLSCGIDTLPDNAGEPHTLPCGMLHIHGYKNSGVHRTIFQIRDIAANIPVSYAKTHRLYTLIWPVRPTPCTGESAHGR